MTHPLGRNAANFARMKRRQRQPLGQAALITLAAVVLAAFVAHVAGKAIGQAAFDAVNHCHVEG